VAACHYKRAIYPISLEMQTFRETSHHTFDRLDTRWFCDVLVETSGESSLQIFRLSIATHGHETHRAQVHIRAEGLGHWLGG
jgi:hypothetical protein